VFAVFLPRNAPGAPGAQAKSSRAGPA